MTFTPGQQFERGGARLSILPSLRSRLAGRRIALAYIALAGVALALTEIVVPAFLPIFVDACLIGDNRGWIGPVVFMLPRSAS